MELVETLIQWKALQDTAFNRITPLPGQNTAERDAEVSIPPMAEIIQGE